jgi:hypothetical protein
MELTLRSRVAAFALLAGCAGCAANVSETEDLANSAQSPLQMEFVGTSEGDTSKWVNLLTSSTTTRWAQSVGAMKLPSGSTAGVTFTCGVTFVSPHYAITAGHCVDGADTDGKPNFKVEQYNTTALNISKVQQQAQVSGSWPNWARGTTLSANDGYNVTTYNACHVVRRCGNFGINIDCPFGGDVDVALIQCDDRPQSLNWTVAFTGEPMDGGIGVEVWWFHELYNLASQPWEENGSQPAGNTAHYSTYDGTPGGQFGQLQNYHYSHAIQQLLPLRSLHWPGGTQYSKLFVSGAVQFTDVPPCHGMSGSGTFPRGSSGLVGPVALGAQSLSNRLCVDMKLHGPGSQQMAYTRPEFTSAMVNQAVQNDRNQ